MSTAEAKKATTRSGNYQDNVSVPLARKHDTDVTATEDPDEDLHSWDDVDDGIIPAVERVSMTQSLMN